VKIIQLNLNINPLVNLLAGTIKCGKNAVYKAKDIAYRAIQAASHNQSLEAMSKLTGVLSSDRMFDHLHGMDEETTRKLIRKVNRKLKLPKKVTLAVDFHEKEYYGDKNHLGVMGSKGGKYVRKVIELSCVSPPLFLDAVLVNQFNNNAKMLLKEFLDGFKQSQDNIKVGLLLIDRGFFSKAVVSMLVRSKTPFIMPAKKDKAIQKLVDLFKQGKLKQRIKYKFGSVYVTLAFLKVEDEVYVYATNTNHTPLKLFMLYTKRWQIETNFREQNKFQFLTRTINFAVRYMAFALAGLLFNAWQLTRRKLKHIKESYLYKYVLIEQLLEEWQATTRIKVIKNIDYFLHA
jgi:hypothetical protein